jgi:hypothetical protein
MTIEDTKDKAGRIARKVLHLPEERVPVVSSIDWIRDIFDFNFVAGVR